MRRWRRWQATCLLSYSATRGRRTLTLFCLRMGASPVCLKRITTARDGLAAVGQSETVRVHLESRQAAPMQVRCSKVQQGSSGSLPRVSDCCSVIAEGPSCQRWSWTGGWWVLGRKHRAVRVFVPNLRQPRWSPLAFCHWRGVQRACLRSTVKSTCDQFIHSGLVAPASRVPSRSPYLRPLFSAAEQLSSAQGRPFDTASSTSQPPSVVRSTRLPASHGRQPPPAGAGTSGHW